MKKEITEYYCDICGKLCNLKEIECYSLPVRDLVADAYANGSQKPNIKKSTKDLCFSCELSIANYIESLVKKTGDKNANPK